MPINFTLYHSFNRFLKQPQENHNKAKTDWEYFGGTNISLSKWFQSRHLARFDYLARPEDLCSANISKVNIWQISRFSKLRGRQSLPNMPSFNKFGKLAHNWQHSSYIDCQNVTLPGRTYFWSIRDVIHAQIGNIGEFYLQRCSIILASCNRRGVT